MPDYKPAPVRLNAPSADSFNQGHAMSFETQPNLKALFEAVADPETQLTIVVGAGLSLDAEFPSWGSLVDRLADKIKSKRFRNLVTSTDDDPMRKAESVLRLIAPTSTSSDADEIREALYRGIPQTSPGPLARAVARIALQTRNRCRIITTNFDDVIETALESASDEQPKAYSLYEEGEEWSGESEVYRGAQRWLDATEDYGPLAVLHLHGMLRRRMPPLEPVVLAESHFLRHGPKVREMLGRELANRTVIFIGVSLTDPNLVGPLWDTAHQQRGSESPRCFVLHVPGQAVGAQDADESRAFALARYEYFEAALRVSPIFLKSYSQLQQVFIELELHLSIDDYLDSDTTPALNYGSRFKSALSSCYTAVTGEKNLVHDEIDIDRSVEIASKLRGLIDPDTVAGRILYQSDPQLRGRILKLKRKFRDFDRVDEAFGLFLWLRTIPSFEDESVPYALSLVATSTYTHFSHWSFDRTVLVEPGSDFPAAAALYSGNAQVQNLDSAGLFSVYRGALAIPITVGTLKSRPDLSLDGSVTVGTLVLNTTHDPFPEERKSGDARVSVLAAVPDDPNAAADLVEALSAGCAEILES